ncbi:hypothetical protein EUGRSUZ_F03535 [Eucalyptus grandis]|uniref:Uncharacterized protein n=2 Tax=Eucalyptus grandis TaxID=71139 RepID=A0ACC3KP30_EUCGR|nr:hypothetical protein EUGRSUZ_F03535 [Eucalyptus grandis]
MLLANHLPLFHSTPQNHHKKGKKIEKNKRDATFPKPHSIVGPRIACSLKYQHSEQNLPLPKGQTLCQGKSL